MSTSTASVILDDTFSGTFIYDNISTWSQVISPGTYLQTSHVASGTPALDRGGELNYVQILFSGAGLALYGTTPPQTNPLDRTFSVEIDGTVQTVNSDYGDPNPPSYRMWYQSPPLLHGPHNITLLNVLNASIDYAVVQHSNNPFILAGQTVIVDNIDPSISYSDGNWTASNASFSSAAQNLPPGTIMPYGGNTQTTSAVGDHFTFTFSGGSDVTVFGMMDWTKFGNLTLSVLVDGGNFFSVNYPVSQNSTGAVNGWGQQANFPFFSIPTAITAAPGTHTVLVNVVECSNQTFTFDYITYIGPAPVVEPSSQPTTSPSGPSRGERLGQIIGGAVGGLVFILLVVLALDCVRRRKRQVRTRYEYPFNQKVDKIVSPIPLEQLTSPQDIKKKPDEEDKL